MKAVYKSISAPLFTKNEAKSIISNVETDEEKVSNIVSKAEEIVKEVCTYSDSKYDSRTRKIDKVLTSKKFGIPIMILFLALIFWITITGANYPSSLLSSFFSFVQDKLLLLFANMHAPEFLTNVLIYRNVSNCNLGCRCYAASYGYIFPSFYFA